MVFIVSTEACLILIIWLGLEHALWRDDTIASKEEVSDKRRIGFEVHQGPTTSETARSSSVSDWDDELHRVPPRK